MVHPSYTVYPMIGIHIYLIGMIMKKSNILIYESVQYYMQSNFKLIKVEFLIGLVVTITKGIHMLCIQVDHQLESMVVFLANYVVSVLLQIERFLLNDNDKKLRFNSEFY